MRKSQHQLNKPRRHKEHEGSLLLGFTSCSSCLRGERTNERKQGSALIMVLAVVVILAVVIADFASDMRSELKAAGGYYDGAINFQLARSALALARLELSRQGTQLYANGYGDAYLVSGTEDYESAIEELEVYRTGYELGRGMLSYKLVYSPAALDPNELGQAAWHRLLEMACDMEEGEERSSLVDSILDWIDTDNLARANGAEEDDYQNLDRPRHVKNGPLDSPEELLLVEGMTPALFYGEGIPLREEDNMLWGGGIVRYLIGDKSPAGRASGQFVLRGVFPDEDAVNEEDELEYVQVQNLPEQLYLIAQGSIPDGATEDEADLFYEETPDPVYLSRHIILIRLKRGTGNSASYEINDMLENAGSEAVERILAYGVPEEI